MLLTSPLQCFSQVLVFRATVLQGSFLEAYNEKMYSYCVSEMKIWFRVNNMILFYIGKGFITYNATFFLLNIFILLCT